MNHYFAHLHAIAMVLRTDGQHKDMAAVLTTDVIGCVFRGGSKQWHCCWHHAGRHYAGDLRGGYQIGVPGAADTFEMCMMMDSKHRGKQL